MDGGVGGAGKGELTTIQIFQVRSKGSVCL
jgi:hypothetical protein